MKVLITGGTGLLGSALAAALRQRNHEVTVLTRRPRGPGEVAWAPDNVDRGAMEAVVAGTDAVVNLAGAPIASGRWSRGRKEAIRASRVNATRAVAQAIAGVARPPKVLLSGSAIGYYGVGDETPVDESAPAGQDFLAGVCVEWEASALAASRQTRLVWLRTGVVLDNTGGALPAIARPFRWGLGGQLGTGEQYMSWIYLDDWVGLVMWTLENEAIAGALNLTAPTPVTNREFSKILAYELRRPAMFHMPAALMRLALGEMADLLLLGGQRVVPARAMASGFTFRFEHLAAALHAIYG